MGWTSFTGWLSASFKGGDCCEVRGIGDMDRLKGGVGIDRVVVVERLNSDDCS